MNYCTRQNKINSIILLGFMLFFFKPTILFSQQQSILDSIISYRAKNIPLHQALYEIGDVVGFEFSYNSDLIASNSKVKVSFYSAPLRGLLSELLNDSTLSFKVVDKQIVISKKNQIEQLASKNGLLKNKGFLQINGNVYDKISGESMPFANISVLGKSMGTISNENGNFNIKLSVGNLLDTLVISYIGYKNSYLPIKELSLYNNKIYLREDNFQIQEVVIRSNNPEIILEKALENIKDNYYTDPYYITSFYREIVNKSDELAAITEAVLKIYKSPYMGLYSDQVKLIKSRKNEYFTRSDTVSLKLKGGLYSSLYLDVIKNPMYFLDTEYFHLYSYAIDGIVNFNNSTAYIIRFFPKNYMGESSFEGKIYVDTDNLAIVEVDFNIVPEAIEKMANTLVVKKTFRTRVTPVSAKYIISYRKVNKSYFLNLARGELDFKVKRKRNIFSKNFKAIFELAANEVDTIGVERFSRIETIPQNDVFIDEYYQYDRQFWGEYNYISPNESLEEALVRIKKKLDNIEE